MSKRRLGTNEAHRRTRGRVSHPDLLADPKAKTGHLVLKGSNGVCAQGTYVHLISGDGNDFSFMPFIQGAGKSDSPAPSQVSPPHVATAK